MEGGATRWFRSFEAVIARDPDLRARHVPRGGRDGVGIDCSEIKTYPFVPDDASEYVRVAEEIKRDLPNDDRGYFTVASLDVIAGYKLNSEEDTFIWVLHVGRLAHLRVETHGN
jgi:hypothetical protein